jgi:hypothetical protein
MRFTHLSRMEGLSPLRGLDNKWAEGEVKSSGESFFSEPGETLFCGGGELALTPCTPKLLMGGFCMSPSLPHC